MTAFTPDDADFRQFATFDRPVKPPATLVDAIPQPVAALRIEPDIGKDSIAMSSASAPSVVPTRSVRSSRNVSPSFQVAAAILIVVSLIGSLFLLNRPSEQDNRDNLAFQPSGDLTVDVNNAGDPGGSWVVGNADPAMSAAVELDSVLGDQVGFEQTRIRGIVIGDSYIFPTFTNGRGSLHRSDLGGQASVWSIPVQALSNIVSDGENVYLESTTYLAGTSPGLLTAVSVETGEIVWQIAGIESSEQLTASLVISDGMLYVANTAGDVMAVSAREGVVRWTTAVDPQANPNPDALARTPAAPFVALGDAGLFVVRNDQAVVRIDPATGEVTGTVDVANQIGSTSFVTIPTVRGDTLALLVGYLSDGEDNSLTNTVPIVILSIDANTLSVEHQVDFADLRGGNIALTDDAIYVPVADAATSPAGIAKIDLATGDVTHPFGDVTSTTLLFPSVSGDTLMVVTGDSRDATFIDRRSGDLLASVETGFQLANGGFFFQPIQLWHGQPFAVDGLGGVHLIVDDPGSLPVATPLATPG